MQRRFMAITVTTVCHLIIPLGLGASGFCVLAFFTHDLLWALAGGAIAWLVAWLTARHYALVAIRKPVAAVRQHCKGRMAILCDTKCGNSQRSNHTLPNIASIG